LALAPASDDACLRSSVDADATLALPHFSANPRLFTAIFREAREVAAAAFGREDQES
jgi:hypothetical protein